MTQSPPFGAYAPTPVEARIRRLAHGLPYTYAGRKIASLLLGPAGGRDGRPRDVEVFGGAYARLHAYDNIAEKRVYLTPHHWDPDERALLSTLIAGSADGDIRFVDIGANAGLYTLFAHQAAREHGKTFRALCVEPDAVMAARLKENMRLSGIDDQVTLKHVAVAAEAGNARLAINATNRGMTRLSDEAGVAVETETLARLINDWTTDERPPHVLKIDIEGMELPVLKAFFETAPNAPRPQTIQTEISHEGEARGALRAMLGRNGYRAIFENRLNLIATRA